MARNIQGVTKEKNASKCIFFRAMPWLCIVFKFKYKVTHATIRTKAFQIYIACIVKQSSDAISGWSKFHEFCMKNVHLSGKTAFYAIIFGCFLDQRGRTCEQTYLWNKIKKKARILENEQNVNFSMGTLYHVSPILVEVILPKNILKMHLGNS